jgi:hypothetical protein
MTNLVLRVPGVAVRDKTLATSKPGYQAQVEGTNAFIPFLPRNEVWTSRRGASDDGTGRTPFQSEGSGATDRS